MPGRLAVAGADFRAVIRSAMLVQDAPKVHLQKNTRLLSQIQQGDHFQSFYGLNHTRFNDIAHLPYTPIHLIHQRRVASTQLAARLFRPDSDTTYNYFLPWPR